MLTEFPVGLTKDPNKPHGPRTISAITIKVDNVISIHPVDPVRSTRIMVQHMGEVIVQMPYPKVKEQLAECGLEWKGGNMKNLVDISVLQTECEETKHLHTATGESGSFPVGNTTYTWTNSCSACIQRKLKDIK